MIVIKGFTYFCVVRGSNTRGARAGFPRVTYEQGGIEYFYMKHAWILKGLLTPMKSHSYGQEISLHCVLPISVLDNLTSEQ